jgi:SAM-dependent methyltransferase
VKCRICGNNDDNKSYLIKEMMFGLPDQFDYFQCAECNCLQISEQPKDMERFYSSGYYSYNVPVAAPLLKRLNRILRNRMAFYSAVSPFMKPFAVFFDRQPLHIIARTGVNRDSSILDVGCGAGSLLLSLRDIGFSNLTGADPYIQKDLDHGNDVKILKSGIDELSGKWDLVMFNHSFEHIPNPAGALKSVARILKEDGTCLIRIPTVSSFAWNHYGVNWVQIDAPRHLFLHSVKSIELLAQKGGFELADIVYDSSIMQFYGSEQLVQGIPYMSERSFAINRKESIFTHSDIKKFRERAKALNIQHLGDQAAFFLRRKA